LLKEGESVNDFYFPDCLIEIIYSNRIWNG